MSAHRLHNLLSYRIQNNALSMFLVGIWTCFDDSLALQGATPFQHRLCHLITSLVVQPLLLTIGEVVFDAFVSFDLIWYTVRYTRHFPTYYQKAISSSLIAL